MLKSLWHTLLPGDIALGDRMYGCFVFLAAMPMQGVDVVARLSQGRNLDLRRAPKLGPNDWLTSLPKPPQPPAYMTPAEWKTLPASIPVRVIRSCLQVNLNGAVGITTKHAKGAKRFENQRYVTVPFLAGRCTKLVQRAARKPIVATC